MKNGTVSYNRLLKMLCLLCLSVVLGTAMSGCMIKETGQPEAPALLEPVGNIADTATVTKGDISNTRILDAQVIPYTEELGFAMDGIIAEVKVKIGDEVKKGDIIAVLDGAGDGNEYDSAVEELEQRTNSYSEENLVAEYDIKIMETELKQLKSGKGGGVPDIDNQIAVKEVDIQLAKEELEGKKEIQKIELKELKRRKEAAYDRVKAYYLYAAMDGKITYLNMSPGDEVTANSFVVALSDMNNMQIKSEFITKRELNSADDYYVMYKGRHYKVKQHEYDPDEIDSLVDEDKKPYAYYDILDSDAECSIGDTLDMYVISDEKKDVLLIPVNALYKEGAVYYVYKKSGDTKAKTEVTVGTKTSSMVQIMDGLQEGDIVYVKE